MRRSRTVIKLNPTDRPNAKTSGLVEGERSGDATCERDRRGAFLGAGVRGSEPKWKSKRGFSGQVSNDRGDLADIA